MKRLLLDKKARAQIVHTEFYFATVFTLLMKFHFCFHRSSDRRVIVCYIIPRFCFMAIKGSDSCSFSAEIIIKQLLNAPSSKSILSKSVLFLKYPR